MRIFKHLRAAGIIGLTWGAMWAIAGATLMTWRVFTSHLATPLHYWARFAVTGASVLGVCGVVIGALFALGLRRYTSAREFDSLRLAVATRWGAMAGCVSVAAIPIFGLKVTIGPLLTTAVITGCIGAASALATVTIARRSIDSGGHARLRA